MLGDILGSTPRMRGIFIVLYRALLNGRFNPAYAGNIYTGGIVSHSLKVQPRVCGEYPVSSIASVIEPGSTPRMRGILFYI